MERAGRRLERSWAEELLWVSATWYRLRVPLSALHFHRVVGTAMRPLARREATVARWAAGGAPSRRTRKGNHQWHSDASRSQQGPAFEEHGGVCSDDPIIGSASNPTCVSVGLFPSRAFVRWMDATKAIAVHLKSRAMCRIAICPRTLVCVFVVAGSLFVRNRRPSLVVGAVPGPPFPLLSGVSPRVLSPRHDFHRRSKARPLPVWAREISVIRATARSTGIAACCLCLCCLAVLSTDGWMDGWMDSSFVCNE